MNKDKISAQDIIDSLAAKVDTTKHSAEDFFKAFIANIEEALLANDSVKIKNLGTFKLNWIAPRKSVNVQTGEDILIEGYYKVVFSPDKDLKDLVNQPFAHLEPVILDEENPTNEKTEGINPLNSLSEQADEIKDLLSEIQSMSTDNNSSENIITEKQQIPQAEDKQEEPVIVNVEEILLTPAKKKRTWLWILLAIVLLFGTATAFYFLCMPVQHWANKTFFGHDTAAYDAARERSNLAEEWFQTNENKETAVAIDDFQEAFDNRMNNSEYIATEKLNSGSRLAYLAERHYGSPYFWVYIYEVNTDRISDPDDIQAGTTVRIPKIDPLLIDLDNPRSMEKALELRKKYLN